MTSFHHPRRTRKIGKFKPQSTQRALKKIQRSQRTQWFINPCISCISCFRV